MIIAHDLGTTGNKASLHRDDGRLVTSATEHYPAHYADGGVAEQHPQDWWAAVCAATRSLLATTGTSPASVRAVGFSGQMMGAVVLDSAHEPVRPALIWADHRSVDQAAELEGRLGADRAYRHLGHRLHPTYTLAKLLWLRAHEPESYRRIAHVCLAKDFVVHRLTGELVTDPSDASSTNAYDQGAGAWSAEVLQASGVDPGLFPPIVPSTTVAGGVTASAAAETGLAVGTPVVVGGGDGPLAALGTGVIDPGDGAYTYLGSSSWISMSAEKPLHDPIRRSMTFDHVVPGHYVPTATMQAGGASLDWIGELLLPGGPGGEGIDRLVGAADPADTAGLYFLPHLMGERSPHWNALARGAFVGLARHHDRTHLTRAVLEGVAFNLATCLDAFADAGRRVDRVDAIGGGALSDVWLQILADTWGTTVRRRSIVEGANSLGAAVTAAVGTGLLDDLSAARSLSEVTAEFESDAERHGALRERHSAFQDAYAALEPWFEQRHP